MLIFKILTVPEWVALDHEGQSPGAPVDVADGYVHFSTAAQLRETATKHFAGKSSLMLVAMEAEAMGEALKWEPSRGGALFPHLYAPLRREDVLWAVPLPLRPDGTHDFPDGVLPEDRA